MPSKPRPSALDWLLEPADPGVRYLALRDLVKTDARSLAEAKAEAHARGPIARVLAEMQPEGFWEKPGPGYGPKYKSTVWALILLAQLGADVSMDARLATACNYLLDHALCAGGQFTYNRAPSGTFDCLQGNLTAALTAMGCTDARLETAYDWLARTVTGEGLAPMGEKTAARRYYVYKCGPGFACGANHRLPCAWGAAKVMLALGKLPPAKRTPLITRAIRAGTDFLLGTEPAEAGYPTPNGGKPSGNWWKFAFPLFCMADILQVVEVLAALGYGRDPRLARALALVESKQDSAGRWALGYNYGAKTWDSFGRAGQPSKWVTLRARRALRLAESA